jgi:hypothetical protein
MGTLQHEIFGGRRALAFASGDAVQVNVDCRIDAGRVTTPVRYGLAVSIEMATTVRADIDAELRQALRGGPFWQHVRDLLDQWWQAHPSGGRADIRGRIRNSDDAAFEPAFGEMYVYQVLRRVYESVEEHPRGFGTRRPDFLAASATQGEVVVEVTSTATSEQDRASSRRLGAIYDAVNSLHFDRFVVMVRPVDQGRQVPRTSGLKRSLTAWVNALDYEPVRASYELGAGYFDDRARAICGRAAIGQLSS